jgi:hypothetical protein
MPDDVFQMRPLGIGDPADAADGGAVAEQQDLQLAFVLGGEPGTTQWR